MITDAGFDYAQARFANESQRAIDQRAYEALISPFKGLPGLPAQGLPANARTIASAARLMGCVCPGDATPWCENPLCPRKAGPKQ